jgi:Dullard-like phosphatase family protein
MPINGISNKLGSGGGGSSWAQFTGFSKISGNEHLESKIESDSSINKAFTIEKLVDVTLDDFQRSGKATQNNSDSNDGPEYVDENGVDLGSPSPLQKQPKQNNFIENPNHIGIWTDSDKPSDRSENDVTDDVLIAKKAESEPDLARKTHTGPSLHKLSTNSSFGSPSESKDSVAPPLPPLHLPIHLRSGDKPVLVLDLDETLIHSSLVPRRPADFWIEVVQNGDIRSREVFWVYKRPGVDQFLKEIAKHYTLLVFTAGIREYASQILDELDPDHSIFSGRLYRDACTEMRPLQGSFLVTPTSTFAKDLSKVCIDLSRTILVDNTPGCFALQPGNFSVAFHSLMLMRTSYANPPYIVF